MEKLRDLVWEEGPEGPCRPTKRRIPGVRVSDGHGGPTGSINGTRVDGGKRSTYVESVCSVRREGPGVETCLRRYRKFRDG